MKELDFIIIGAQKSGTTTLWKLLDEHPEIFVPPGKELAFFNKDPFNNEGYQAFMRDHFGCVKNDQIIGKVTPHYLNDPMAAKRIEEKIPNCKLIVILRDPAERTLSHFRMSIRRELEKRSFEEMILQELRPESLEITRVMRAKESSEGRAYIAWSEYGRLLQSYKSYHDKGQLLILLTSELKSSPEITMGKLLSFLDLPMVKLPSLGKKFHEGGTSQKFNVIKFLKRVPFVTLIWGLIQPSLRKRILFHFNQWNITKSKDSINNYDKRVVAKLRSHFSKDKSLLRPFMDDSTQEVFWEIKK